MNANWTALMLLLAVVWPLLLAGGLVTPGLRGAALRFLPWAALPALVTAFMPYGAQVPLPDFLLGSALSLDGTSRVFLLLNAVLWLAGGVLATPRHSITLSPQQGVLLLLAMAGTMGMALAADALLFFAFSTVTGYSVLGCLLSQGCVRSRRAGGILVVLLVLSDLLLFELFLHLAHEAVGTEFAAFRHVMAGSHSKGLILGLLIVGLGIKTAIVGLHFWLPPAFREAAVMTRPVLVSFILTAGILGWVRLLPLGEVQWSGAGDLLRWLGAATVAYAVLASGRGLGSSTFTAYAAMAMNGVWLAVMGAVLSYPQLWKTAVVAAWPAMLQAGWALTAWMLIEGLGRDSRPPWPKVWLSRLQWVAVGLLATSPLTLTGALQTGVGVLPSLLAAAAVFLIAGSPAASMESHASGSPVERAAAATSGVHPGWAMLALLLASLLSALYGFSRLPFAYCLQAAWMVSAAALLAWLLRKPLRLAQKMVPTEPFGGTIVGEPVTVIQSGRELIGTRFAHWRDRLVDRVRALYSNPRMTRWLGVAETGFTRWRNAFALILMAMLVAVGWSWDW